MEDHGLITPATGRTEEDEIVINIFVLFSSEDETIHRSVIYGEISFEFILCSIFEVKH